MLHFSKLNFYPFAKECLYKLLIWRDVVRGWAEWALAHPEIWVSVNPILTRGQIMPTTLMLLALHQIWKSDDISALYVKLNLYLLHWSVKRKSIFATKKITIWKSLQNFCHHYLRVFFLAFYAGQCFTVLLSCNNIK